MMFGRPFETSAGTINKREVSPLAKTPSGGLAEYILVFGKKQSASIRSKRGVAMVLASLTGGNEKNNPSACH